MSSIPPVLMLWLLVVSLPLPPAEAGEMMDLFALIRGTLKYWRRIYQMYEEEVALGYCWAEYFLHHEEDAANATIPSSQSIDPSNFLPVEMDGFEKEHWNHWGVIAIENRGTRYRSKRSYAIQSSTKKEEEILGTSRNSKTMYSRIKQKYKSRWNGLESNFTRNKNNRCTSCATFPKNTERKLAVLTADSGKETPKSTKKREVSKTWRKNFSPCSKNMENVELRSNWRFAAVSSNLANRTRIDSRGYRRNGRSYRRHNFKEKDEISKILNKHVRASSKNWTRTNVNFRSIEFPIDTREYSYSERSRETLNSTREKEILENIGARDATPIENSVRIVSNASLGSSVTEFEWNRKNSISRSTANNGPANFMKSVASKLISKVSRKNSKTTEWNVSVKKFATFDTHSGTGEAKLEANVKTRNPENDDPVKYERFPRNAPRRGRRSSEISNSVDANIEETSKIASNAFARELASWNTRSKTSKMKFKSNELCSSSGWKDVDPVTDRIEQAFAKDTQHDYSALANKRSIEPSRLLRNSSVDKFSNTSKSSIFERRKGRKVAVEDPTSDVRSKTSKAKVWPNERRNAVGSDSRSINCVCRKGIWLPIVDDVGGVSLLVPSSSTKEQPENREDRSSPSEKTEKMARMDAEFKRTRAEGDLSGKSENLRVDRRRKLLFSKTNRVTSGTLSRLEPSKRSRSLSLGEIASLNRRFKNTETSKRVDNSRKPSDVFRLREFGPSNLAFQNTWDKIPGTWWDNYQRNLRRKREANDRTRSRFVRSPSKSKRASFYNPMTLREIARFGARYTTSNYDVWTNGVKNLSRSEEGSLEGNAKGSYETRFDDPKETVYRSKRYQDSGPAISRESPIVVEEAESGLFRLKSESKNRKWLESRKEWNAWKRSSTTNDDNRYRRNGHGYIVETSVTERTGKKSTTRRPEGGPSLFPVTYQRFMGDYGSRSSTTTDQGRRSSMAKVETRETNTAHDALFYFRQVFMGFLRTLGFFVNVGRQLMNYVDSNSVLACTKDYLLGKAIHWIES